MSNVTGSQTRDGFLRRIARKLAERASYICSNPGCNRITIGPSTADSRISAKSGVAAHICAASRNGPRYDISQTPSQRSGIQNGIWLCASCAALIDKNQGIDYPAEHLRRWKADHEALIKSCLEGGKRVVFQFLDAPADADSARTLLKYLEKRGALFMPYQAEVPQHVIESVKEIRTFLTQFQAGLSPQSPLDTVVDSMSHACRHFMNTTPPGATVTEMTFGLGALRKILGLNIGQLEQVYGLTINGPLQDAIPR